MLLGKDTDSELENSVLISGGDWNIYFPHPVRTGSVPHPDFYTIGTGTEGSGVNRPEREADQLYPCNGEDTCVRKYTATLLCFCGDIFN
jgi:hypothetical protein